MEKKRSFCRLRLDQELEKLKADVTKIFSLFSDEQKAYVSFLTEPLMAELDETIGRAKSLLEGASTASNVSGAKDIQIRTDDLEKRLLEEQLASDEFRSTVLELEEQLQAKNRWGQRLVHSIMQETLAFQTKVTHQLKDISERNKTEENEILKSKKDHLYKLQYSSLQTKKSESADTPQLHSDFLVSKDFLEKLSGTITTMIQEPEAALGGGATLSTGGIGSENSIKDTVTAGLWSVGPTLTKLGAELDLLRDQQLQKPRKLIVDLQRELRDRDRQIEKLQRQCAELEKSIAAASKKKEDPMALSPQDQAVLEADPFGKKIVKKLNALSSTRPLERAEVDQLVTSLKTQHIQQVDELKKKWQFLLEDKENQTKSAMSQLETLYTEDIRETSRVQQTINDMADVVQAPDGAFGAIAKVPQCDGDLSVLQRVRDHAFTQLFRSAHRLRLHISELKLSQPQPQPADQEESQPDPPNPDPVDSEVANVNNGKVVLNLSLSGRGAFATTTIEPRVSNSRPGSAASGARPPSQASQPKSSDSKYVPKFRNVVVRGVQQSTGPLDVKGSRLITASDLYYPSSEQAIDQPPMLLADRSPSPPLRRPLSAPATKSAFSARRPGSALSTMRHNAASSNFGPSPLREKPSLPPEDILPVQLGRGVTSPVASPQPKPRPSSSLGKLAQDMSGLIGWEASVSDSFEAPRMAKEPKKHAQRREEHSTRRKSLPTPSFLHGPLENRLATKQQGFRKEKENEPNLGNGRKIRRDDQLISEFFS